MYRRNPVPFPLILLAGITLIAVIFSVCYVRARLGDRGTSFDDSPAAEIGAGAERRELR